MHKTRAYGQGECRIGKSMEFSEDIYSLCFVSQAADDVMDPLFDVIEGRHLNKWDEAKETEAEEGIEEEDDMPSEKSSSEEGDEEKKLIEAEK